jgi:hypothetical protein
MRLFAALVIAASAAACATTPPGSTSAQQSGGDCFRPNNVAGYSVIDDHNINVRISGNRSYTLNTNWNVHDLDWTHAIELRSSNGWICTGNVFGNVEVASVQTGTDAFSRTYPINTVTRNPERPADQQGS